MVNFFFSSTVDFTTADCTTTFLFYGWGKHLKEFHLIRKYMCDKLDKLEENPMIALIKNKMNWIIYRCYLWKFILFLLDHSVIIFFIYIFNSSVLYWHIDYNLIYLYCYICCHSMFHWLIYLHIILCYYRLFIILFLGSFMKFGKTIFISIA